MFKSMLVLCLLVISVANIESGKIINEKAFSGDTLNELTYLERIVHRFKRDETAKTDSANKLEYETFNPCEDGFITMDRYIGLPYEEENYFNGTAHLERYRKYIPHAELEIELDSTSSINVDPKIARVSVTYRDRRFLIRTHVLPSILNFTVRSAALRPFPNIKRVVLNGKDLCDNPKKWAPTLQGPSSFTDDISSRIFVSDDAETAPTCGRRRIEDVALVTHSQESEPGDWPWHVAIYRKLAPGAKKYRCGGTIISQSIILTAAHCCVTGARPIPAEALSVFVGKYYLDEEEKYSKEYQVSKVIIHNKFNPRNLKNDIALSKLSQNIVYSNYVQPVCMWNFKQLSKNYLFGEIGTLVGWGSVKPNTNISETLRSGTMELVSDTTCLLSYSSFFENFLSEDTFCAGTGGRDGTSACNGDSGGGLFFNVTLADGVPTWYLRGIVSVSVSLNGSCDPSHYTIFTDTVRYIPWIHEHWL